MRPHVDLLGYLHLIWGAFALLTGTALGILAIGTDAAALELGSAGTTERAAVWLFVFCAAALVAFGTATALVGRSLQRGRGRVAAMVLAAPNVVIVPFGTLLAIYTIWVLQNDDARRMFGAPPPGTPPARTTWVEGR